jgi:hypothetical protein
MEAADKRKPDLHMGVGFKSTPVEGWRRHQLIAKSQLRPSMNHLSKRICASQGRKLGSFTKNLGLSSPNDNKTRPNGSRQEQLE